MMPLVASFAIVFAFTLFLLQDDINAACLIGMKRNEPLHCQQNTKNKNKKRRLEKRTHKSHRDV
jgi:hypothetical protein